VTEPNDPRTALEYHLLTRHGSRVEHPERLVEFVPLDPTNRPAPFKRYPDRQQVPLPRDLGVTGVTAVAVLSGTYETRPAAVDATVLARLLFYAAGVTRTSTTPDGSRTYFRAAMSAGNLHPVEVYVVSGGLAGVPAGVHHFSPLAVGLTLVRELPAGGPLMFVLTGVPWRTAWKYGERGFRHLYWDAGTLLANLLAMAATHGLDARVHAGFPDETVAALIGIDGVTEVPLAIVTLDGNEPVLPDALDPIAPRVAPISREPIEFPVVTATQQVGGLADPTSVSRWRATAASLRPNPATTAVRAPDDAPGDSIEDVILRRGSTRIMRREPSREALLTWGMAVASRPVPGDFVAAGGTLLDHYLSVHAVDGVPAGAYRWRAGHLEQGQLGELRAVARKLCLDQPLGGDSSYTAFHSSDLDEVLGGLGARGYRAALLESGIASGRLSLAAFALGGGATGLTFFDEAVRQFFGTRAACMLVTSVGLPAYRNTTGGLPGAASELRHFDDLMLRLSRQLRAGGDF
jgi:SagB-type dehydrogenase family enzyme